MSVQLSVFSASWQKWKKYRTSRDKWVDQGYTRGREHNKYIKGVQQYTCVCVCEAYYII